MRVIAILLLFSLGCGTPQRTESTDDQPVSETARAAQQFLRAQQLRSAAMVKRVEEAKNAGKLDEAISALEQRKRELLAALRTIDDGIGSGHFYADDRALLTGPVEEELSGVEASLILLRSP